MKVYINRKPVDGPWGGGNMWVKSMYDHFPKNSLELVNLSDNPDVIIIAGIGPENNDISAIQAINYKYLAKQHGKNVKIIFRVNENDARKRTNDVDNTILMIAQHVDHTVFVSNWLSQYFLAKNFVNNSHSIVQNGVDLEIYKPNEKIKNKKINIVTHHWSDNILKGFDIYDQLDNWVVKNTDFSFTYIGRERNTFRNTNVIKPLFGKELGSELGKYDVYVSASRHDPGPNHILESIACGIPTFVHKDGGGCVEFAGVNHSYDCFETLLNMLQQKSYIQNDCAILKSWEDCAKEFANIIKSI